MTSKNVKIPLELLEIIEKRGNGRPPGETLLEIVKDYVEIENYVRSLKLKQTGNERVSEVIRRYYDQQDSNINEVKNSIDELKSLVKGLEIFYTKFGKGKG
jgi:predicted CopG family antitoxin